MGMSKRRQWQNRFRVKHIRPVPVTPRAAFNVTPSAAFNVTPSAVEGSGIDGKAGRIRSQMSRLRVATLDMTRKGQHDVWYE
jgi:hypothetical protein